MKKIIIASAIVLATQLTGCAGLLEKNYYVQVDSYADPALSSLKTYLLEPEGNAAANPLLFKEMSPIIGHYLNMAGYHEAQNPADAELIIGVDYRVGAAQKETYTYEQPIYGEKVDSYVTTGTMQGYGNTVNINTTTMPITSYGIVGSKTKTGTRTTHDRALRLVAYDAQTFKQTGKVNQAWRVDSFSNGSSGDIRELMPYLAVTAAEHAGHSSGGTKDYTLYPSALVEIDANN